MRFVCDACQDITNIEADRMEIKDDKLLVYNRGRLVYMADLGQIMLAKLTPGREDGNGLRTNRCKSKTCKCRECHIDKNAWEWRGLPEAPAEGGKA